MLISMYAELDSGMCVCTSVCVCVCVCVCVRERERENILCKYIVVVWDHGVLLTLLASVYGKLD